MKFTIQTPHFDARQDLLNFAEEHIQKLESLNDRIIEAQVCLRLDKSDKRENKNCEIKLALPGNDLFASRQSDTFEDAIQQAITALKHQLERWKTSHEQRAEKI